jgi:hypothetical protein
MAMRVLAKPALNAPKFACWFQNRRGGVREWRMLEMIRTDLSTTGMAPALAKATELAAADAEAKRNKPEEGEGVISHLANGVDVVDLGISVCRTAASAMTPDFTTGGKEGAQRFLTGGAEGASGNFQTGADCAPMVDASSSVLETGSDLLSDAASGLVDAVGGLFDGLGSL